MLQRTESEGSLVEGRRAVDAYLYIEELLEARIVRLVRTGEEFSSCESAARSFSEARRAIDRSARRGDGLLVDLRLARGKNDAAFEKAIAPVRQQLMAGFARVAVLVQTPIGLLQVARHAKEDGLGVKVFLVERDAMAFLQST